jgi:ADP-ribose pyrophosphatase YjhB (NUDIX family)
MVLITNGREILLARKPSFVRNRFSALAGFVEAGESLEQTVARESFEEVGVQVKNIRYFGSQSWPFPNSLMIAFVADYAGGEVRPDGVEIEEARWFAPDALPNIPDGIAFALATDAVWLTCCASTRLVWRCCQFLPDAYAPGGGVQLFDIARVLRAVRPPQSLTSKRSGSSSDSMALPPIRDADCPRASSPDRPRHQLCINNAP